ncbi:MAG TPA: hypothetical protein DDW50_04410 [Firmicutes bacterium]|jgi:hypothetical protein|nr:hypothetical protein [Bacillota bacterium]
MATHSPAPKKFDKKKKHLVIVILLSFIIFILLIMTALPIFINPIAGILIKKQVTSIFGDRLKMGSVRISFFTGAMVQINQIELEQAPGFGKKNLLQADSMNIRVAMIPLFHKQLVIKDISILRPVITVIQYQNGDMNLDYYLSKFTMNPHSTSASESTFMVKLNRFRLENGKIILKSYGISHNAQPTLVFNRADFILKNLVMPNPGKTITAFSGLAELGTNHPVPMRIDGTGLFGGNKISFTAKSRIANLSLADYGYLVPNSVLIVKSGRANISSDLNCHNDYLSSYHHVNIHRLQLTPRKGKTFNGTLLGAPANFIIKGIQNGNGRLNFDFTLSGPLSDLRVNAKFKVIQAVTQSLRDKLSVGKIGNATPSNTQKISSQLFKTLGRIFKYRK